jgi:hypothetical protein
MLSGNVQGIVDNDGGFAVPAGSLSAGGQAEPYVALF